MMESQQRHVDHKETPLLDLPELEDLGRAAHYRVSSYELPTLHWDSFFRGSSRKIDFVFVYDRKAGKVAKQQANSYIGRLEAEGLEFESEVSSSNPNLLFIKVHGRTKALIKRAIVQNIVPTYASKTRQSTSKPKKWLKFMHTDLTSGSADPHLLKRAFNAISDANPQEITSAERILLVHDILKTTSYGSQPHEFGIQSLIKSKAFVDAYPLHDGNHLWTQHGPLNDRQLLSRYWAKLTMMFKMQPLKLVQQYYGPEITFYFMFSGFYNKMLIPASICGVFALLYGLCTYNTHLNYTSQSICKSEVIICPYCHFPLICNFQPIKDSCGKSKTAYIMDNTATFAYAIIMCFWATLFLELWKRKQKIAMYQWNLLSLEEDLSIRPEYAARAKLWRMSRNGLGMVPYERFGARFGRIAVSCLVLSIIVVIVLIAVISTAYFRLTVTYLFVKHRNLDRVSQATSAISMAFVNCTIIGFMIGFEVVYEHLSRVLTDYENPRTQNEYDKSFIYKQYLLCFLNAFTFLYYTSFVKGRLFSYPGDSEQYEGLGFINVDVCGPTGCVLDICMLLVMTILGKTGFKIFYHCFKRFVIRGLKRIRKRWDQSDVGHVPLWEAAYNDDPCLYYFLFKDEKELIIQYGYIVLFTAVFPLTPLLALLANLVVIRLEAYRLTKFCRRPVPLRCCGISAWNDVLATMTYVGIITNAFLISWTTHFVPYMIKLYTTDRQTGDYLDYTFSKFKIGDFDNDVYAEFSKGDMREKFCYYLGKRYPPEDFKKYSLNGDYFHGIYVRYVAVFVIECMVLCFTGVLAAAIPDIPRFIQERIAHEKKVQRNKNESDIVNEYGLSPEDAM